MVRRSFLAPAAAVAAFLVAACGSGAASSPARPPASAAATSPSAAATPRAARSAAGAMVRDWPTFGLDAQRSSATSSSAGIGASDARHLRRRRVLLPGVVDSTPILLHDIGGRDLLFATTSYGRTLAVEAASGRIAWDHVPASTPGLEGGTQITNASPVADPSHRFLYAASPDGMVHKLATADGREQPGWPVRVTLDPGREKIADALGLDGGELLVGTGGYFGDAPPYQGHLVAIDTATGHVRAVFNTLCADRRRLIDPRTCPASDSAIWSRAGPVVEPGGRVLVSTGNGPYNGTTNFGDSVLELEPGTLGLRGAYTPTDQQHLDRTDTDLGSSSPALLGAGLVLQGGKDGLLRVLGLSAHVRLGGERQLLPTPGGRELFTAPAVWRHGAATTVYVGDGGGLAAYALRAGRLRRTWAQSEAANSPVLAGGLLFAYDPSGGVRILSAGSGRSLARLPAGAGHWQSPIVADGYLAVAEGDANSPTSTGVLDIFHR